MNDKEKRQQRKRRCDTAKYRACLKSNTTDYIINDSIGLFSRSNEVLSSTTGQRKTAGYKNVRKDRSQAYQKLKIHVSKVGTCRKKVHEIYTMLLLAEKKNKGNNRRHTKK